MVLAPGIEGELLASPLPAMKCVAELRMVGVSHRTADFSVRSALSLNTVQAQDLLGRLKEEGVSEALALSTCNRTEIYFVGVEASQVRSAVCDFCNLDFATFSAAAYHAEEWNAVRHLFAVAAGLRSAAVGESEILGQLKSAFHLAREVNSVGKLLDPLVQRALRAAKRIRTESGLGRRGLSLGSATVRRAFALSHGASSRSVLVLGAGQMAQSVVKNLKHRNHCQVTICNRTDEKALRLAEANGFAMAPWREIESAVRNANVILCAATVERPILDDFMIEMAVSPGTVLVDLGVPANVAHSVKSRHDVKLVSIDELLEEVELNAQQVAELTPKAEALTEKEVEIYATECAEREAAPCIQAIVTQSEEVRRQNLEWALSQVPNATEKERKLLEDLSIRIARGIIGKPIKNLKTNFREPSERAVLARFFEAEA
jgi:glutamyl-tRNA reductase